MEESSLERILGTLSPEFGVASRDNSFTRAPSRQVCLVEESFCFDYFSLILLLQNAEILISPRALLPPRHPSHKRPASRAASVAHSVGRRVVQFVADGITG